jgi:hypothetical protein
MIAVWETDNTIWMADIGNAKPAPMKISATNSKHPSIAQNERGETLIAWAVGTGWQRGGTLAWSLRDANGKVLEESGAPQTKREARNSSGRQVPVWSYPAAAHVSGLGFVVLH